MATHNNNNNNGSGNNNENSNGRIDDLEIMHSDSASGLDNNGAIGGSDNAQFDWSTSDKVSYERAKKTCAERIHKELMDITIAPPNNCSAGLRNDDNIFEWVGIIYGPEGSVYEGGIFALSIYIPVEYPFEPPAVKFDTRIYHCNVSDNGLICLDILHENWSPVLTISSILLSIFSLMADCNPDDPADSAIAAQYRNDRKTHDKTARQWTQKYAT